MHAKGEGEKERELFELLEFASPRAEFDVG